jgi:hypothetical protein
MTDLMKKQMMKRAAKAARPVLKKAGKAARNELRMMGMLRAAEWAVDRATGRNRRSRRLRLAARGLAAAAVALPLGLWVGSRMRATSSAGAAD